MSTEVNTSAKYHERAGQMRKLAEASAQPEMRLDYLALSAQWELLARETEAREMRGE